MNETDQQTERPRPCEEIAKRRTPTDGLPYFCVKCKVGYPLFVKCLGTACKLESKASAALRTLDWQDMEPPP